MKATDIMIGDWVYLSETARFPMQVTEIDEDDCLLDFDGNESDPFDGIYEEEGIAPIPLTEKLLKDNGANYDCNETFYIDNITLKQKGDVFYFGMISIRFVHELQHLFRLCNLNNRADFFKLKND